MSVKSIAELKNLCEKMGMAPSKMRGQNFLVDEEVLKEIVTAAELTATDTILEIGPGFGALLEELIKRAGKVVAVELDRKIFTWLWKKFEGVKNLELIQGDILKLLDGLMDKFVDDKFDGNCYGCSTQAPELRPALREGRDSDYGANTWFKDKKYKVVANLPYSITARILWELLSSATPPSEMVVMVQKEVGERICASSGKMSVLSVMAQYYSEPEIVKVVSRESFWPMPEVESVILKAKLKKQLTRNKEYENYFFKIVKIGFSSKRKMLKNNLENVYNREIVERVMGEVGLDLKIRAEGLAVAEWVELFKQLTRSN